MFCKDCAKGKSVNSGGTKHSRMTVPIEDTSLPNNLT